MNHRPFAAGVALVLSTLQLTGCSGESASATTATSPRSGIVATVTAPRIPSFTIFGADRTGSYEDMTKLALSIAASLIDRAGPGDELVMRWISDRSYQTDQVFTHLRMPMSLQSGPVNRFDTRARYQTALFQQQITKAKQEAKKRIASLHPSSTRKTDIYGFLAAAVDYIQTAPNGYALHVVLATDLEDNTNYKVQPDLRQAQVSVIAIKTAADPNAAARLKDRWKNYFQKSNASSVEFINAESITANNP